MTKTTLLAAASVAAMIFAGSAQAGEISGFFGTDAAGNRFQSAIEGTRSALIYNVASEKVVTAASKVSGTIYVANELDTPIAVAAGSATRDYLVAFTISGATVKSSNLALNVDLGAGFVVANTATLVSNQNGVVTYLVSVAAGTTANAFQLEADVEQSAQAPVTASSTVTAVIGGSNILVDSAAAVVAARYTAALKGVSATSTNTLNALLGTTPGDDDYVTFGPLVTGGTLAEDFTIFNSGNHNIDLNGTDATAAVLLDTATITVKGPAINDAITVGFTTAMTDANTASTPANTQVFTLTATENQTFAAGGTDLEIDNDGSEEYVAGDYTVTYSTRLKNGYTAPAASTTNAGAITLEGTSFTAPWVSGTGLASSVIRVSNSNSAASEPVTVRMISGTQVSGGASTPFVSTAEPLVVGSVPARGDLVITSAQLVAHFGAFTRGDFRVTVNQEGTGLVAKLRNTRDGQSFEQSLAD